MKKTLAFKLVFGGVVAVLIPLLIVGSFAATRSSTALRSAADVRSGMVAKNVASIMDMALRQELKNVTALSTDPVFTDGDLAAMGARLATLTKAIGEHYEAIIVVDEHGIVKADGLGGATTGIDISGRQYFADAKNGKSSVGTPVKSRNSGNPISVVAVPLYGPGNRFSGALCVVLKIDFLIDIITGTRVGSTGYGFMIDHEGTIIAHPRKELILDLNISKVSGMEGVSKKMLAGESGVASYVFEGIPKLAGFAPVPLTGWSVCLTQDASELLAEAYNIRNIILGVAVFFLLLTGMVIFFFSRTITKPIRRIIEGLDTGADEVTSASEQVSSASQSLAEGASEQAASLEETSASLEEISSMTRQNANNAGEADALMGETRQVVSKANESMSSLTVSMSDISRASEETSKIIKSIEEVAFQTNLLALNAAVEAARAGEAGAGFAVVADEVRNLAMKAAEAAKNTSELIEETVKKVREGSQLVTVTDEAFRQVTAGTTKVAELVSEIAAASSEQAQGVEEVNRAVSEMDKVTQQNAANAEESAAASEELSAQAMQMQMMVNELVSLVEGVKLEAYAVKHDTKKFNHVSPVKDRSAIVPANHKKQAGRNKPKDSHMLIPFDDDDFKDF